MSEAKRSHDYDIFAPIIGKMLGISPVKIHPFPKKFEQKPQEFSKKAWAEARDIMRRHKSGTLSEV